MGNKLLPHGEILLHNNGGEKEFVSVIFKDENFWLTQKVMGELLGCSNDNISLHLKKIFAAISTPSSAKSRTPTTSRNLTARRRSI